MNIKSTDAEWLIHGIHTSGHSLFLTHLRGQKKTFSERFSVEICYSFIGSKVTMPFVFEERSTFERYVTFLEDALPVLLDVPVYIRRKMWLQEDGRPPHFGRQLTAVLNQSFQNRCLGGNVRLDGHRVHLTPLDCRLWRHMKLNTGAELLNDIMDAYAHERNEKLSLTNSVPSLCGRATMCVDNQGGNFSQLTSLAEALLIAS